MSPLAAVDLGTAWASPLFLAILAAVLVLCLWQLVAAALAGRPGRAAALVALIVLLSAPVWVNALVRGEGIPDYDRLSELGDLEDEFDAYVIEGDVDSLEYEAVLEHPTLIVRTPPDSSRPPSPYRVVEAGEHYDVWQRPADPEGKPVLHHMALGEDGEVSAAPDCSEVVGLGLLALSNQLGLPPQSIAIVGAAPDGSTVAVPPGEARNLCGREWDWIEAVGRG
ncbi:MAG TPA: hypothetical protein VFC52_06890 [Solirubrobacterales bacterium]|nr:hypothetical protein [Solirubrobacterales bacterium]